MSRIELTTFTLKQFDSKSVYITKIKYSDLYDVAKITFRRESSDKYYQRKINKNRLSSIIDFIEKNYSKKTDTDKLILFPTPLILAVNLETINLSEKEAEGIAINNDVITIEDITEEMKKITIPKLEDVKPLSEEKPVFIVDGQHRFEAMRKFKLEYSDADCEFLCVLLLNYDIYEQAMVFATVNFNQKPVNRSLYYDIFGAFPGAPSKMKLAHYLVKSLNENEDSPLQRMVRMLGVGEGVISLAFLAQTIMKLFEKSVGKNMILISNLYRENDKEYTNILLIMKNYFRFIKENFSEYWPEKGANGNYSIYTYKRILLKTTGMYALLNIFDYLFDKKKYISSWIEYKNLEKSLMKKFDLIIKNKDDLFGSDSRYSSGAGIGLQKKLYQQMKEYVDQTE